MRHVVSLPSLATALVLAATLSAAGAPAQAGCSAAVDPAAEEILFTFNTLVYAASQSASPAEFRRLQPFLLIYQADARLQARYPLRQTVAAATRLWPAALRQRALSFLLSHPAAVTNYNALMLQLVGPAPRFATYDQAVPGGPAEQHIFADRAELAGLMRDAYQQGQVRSLFAQVQSAWQSAAVCPEHLQALQSRIGTYLRRAPATLMAASKVITNPLMPLGSGVTCVFADGHFVMVVGPTQSSRDQDMLVTHELLHPLLSQMFRQEPRLRLALRQSGCVYAAAVRNNPNGVLTRYVYTSWESYLSEAMVRSISHRLTQVPEAAGATFVVSATVGQQLADYETLGGTFEAATERMTQRLKAQMCQAPLHLSRMPSP